MKNNKSDAKTDSEGYEAFACDLCKSTEAYELPYVREYTNGQVLNICKKCGFIYAPKRRSWKRIADAWSNELYGDPKVLSAQSYSAMNPHVRARLTYICEFTDTYTGGLKGKKLCDIGAGEGEFLQMSKDKGADVFGIEPSKKNCDLLAKRGFKNFLGAAEDYATHMKKTKDPYRADIVTIMWTLEASQNPKQMLEIAHDILKDGGHIVIGTGSRILVPFKKPLHCFLSTNKVDTHPVHFSFNTLKGLLAATGFELVHANPYVENDILAVVGKKVSKDKKIEWKGDDYLKVADFFMRWHKDSLRYR
ncbi:class I SAM-dependent methyltransferase [Candidatus Woesearchaeota archaeon]|nr:class I SAM-dependent methyltransferase [Candidatus Woesearchaeota archaeon]